MHTTVIREIVAFILGRKYYANIVNRRGTAQCDLASFIFRTREEADKHRESLRLNRSFQYVETVSFRSREVY